MENRAANLHLRSVRRPRSVLGVGGRRKQKGRKPGLVCGREVEQWLLSHLPAQTKPRKKQEGVLAAAGGEHCLGHGNDSR
ncbi:MAG: hypothetical protein KJ063_19530 [Anaerolineae bacterium]|nr:hypothetical protein [Anaerolineae bacterium]